MNYHHHENCSNCVREWWGWAKTQSIQPIKGFEDKRNPDGTPFTFQQQQLATRMQMYLIICDLCSRGKSSASIQSIITAFL